MKKENLKVGRRYTNFNYPGFLYEAKKDDRGHKKMFLIENPQKEPQNIECSGPVFNPDFWKTFQIVALPKNGKISLTLSAPKSSKNLKVEEIRLGQVFYAERIRIGNGFKSQIEPRKCLFIKVEHGKIRALHILGSEGLWYDAEKFEIEGYVPVSIEVIS